MITYEELEAMKIGDTIIRTKNNGFPTMPIGAKATLVEIRSRSDRHYFFEAGEGSPNPGDKFDPQTQHLQEVYSIYHTNPDEKFLSDLFKTEE